MHDYLVNQKSIGPWTTTGTRASNFSTKASWEHKIWSHWSLELSKLLTTRNQRWIDLEMILLRPSLNQARKLWVSSHLFGLPLRKESRPLLSGAQRFRCAKNWHMLIAGHSHFQSNKIIPHRIYVWYIYLHLVDFYGKCRWIYHTWILWVQYWSLDTSETWCTSRPRAS